MAEFIVSENFRGVLQGAGKMIEPSLYVPDSDSVISARGYQLIVPWKEIYARYRVFMPTQCRKVFVIIGYAPKLDEEVVRASS